MTKNLEKENLNLEFEFQSVDKFKRKCGWIQLNMQMNSNEFIDEF